MNKTVITAAVAALAFAAFAQDIPQPKVVREADALPGVRGRRQANPDAKLHTLFRRLVDVGNPVVIVEHLLELIAQADWIIDMGPGGGTDGGEVVFTGTPRDLLSCPTSKTAHWIAHFTMVAEASSNSR